MSRNSLYPGFVKIHYTSNGHPHQMIQPVIPSLSGSIWTLAKILGGSYNPWTDGVDAFVAIAKALFNSGDTLDSAELFTLASTSAAPVFQATYAIGVTGTSGSADVPLSELVMVFRTLPKGLMRAYFMETIVQLDIHETEAELPSGAIHNMFEFYKSGDSYVFGRVGGVPQVMTHATTKLNDQLRKKFVLDA